MPRVGKAVWKRMPAVFALAGIGLGLGGASVSADAPSLASGQAAFAQGKFDQARKEYQRLIKADPAQSAARLGLIQSLLRLDRWQEAGLEAQRAVLADPVNADARGLLALAEMRAGEPEAAHTDAALALAKDKDNYWGLIAAGQTAAWDGSHKESQECYARASALEPNRPEAWLGLWETGGGNGISAAELQVADHYLALAPKGHPFDWATPSIQNIVTNETAYWHSFDADPPFHFDEAGSQPTAYTAIFPIQRKGNFVFVSVGINGQPFHLLFDSGASSLLLSPKAARRLALPDKAKSYVMGVQGRSPASLQRADTLMLGSLALHSIPVTVAGFADDLGDGIFGGSILSDYAVTLDFDNNTMTVSRGPGAGYLAQAHVTTASLPLHRYRDHLFVSAHAGNRQAWAMIDTGAFNDFFSLALTHDLSAKTPRSDWREGSFDGRVGIGDSAMQIDYCLTPTKVQLTFDGSTPPATLLQDGLIGQSALDRQLSPSFDFEIGMILGIPLLAQHSRVTIDYPHSLLTMEDPQT